MEEQNLRRLDRKDLLSILVQQNKKIEQLEAQLAQANEQLNDRRIMLEESGSIAEASLKLNGVLSSLQGACDQYVENVRLWGQKQEARYQAKQRATEAQCEAQKKAAEAQCRQMVEEARAESERYWQQAQARVETLLTQTKGLRELLEGLGRK